MNCQTAEKNLCLIEESFMSKVCAKQGQFGIIHKDNRSNDKTILVAKLTETADFTKFFRWKDLKKPHRATKNYFAINEGLFIERI